MTADQIIEDIKLLPRDEQSRVVQFAVELARRRQLPAEDLVVIAQKMLETNDPGGEEALGRSINARFLRRLAISTCRGFAVKICVLKNGKELSYASDSRNPAKT